jgi:hypothetical protein
VTSACAFTSEEQVITERPSNSTPSDWSRDGRWLLTREIDPKTKYDIWRIPVTPDGRLRQDEAPAPYLRTPFNEAEGRFSPEPRPRWVAYTSDESGQLEVYIDAFPEPRGKRRISIAGGRGPQWGAGGRELYYVSPDNKLMAVDLKLGADRWSPPRLTSSSLCLCGAPRGLPIKQARTAGDSWSMPLRKPFRSRSMSS